MDCYAWNVLPISNGYNKTGRGTGMAVKMVISEREKTFRVQSGWTEKSSSLEKGWLSRSVINIDTALNKVDGEWLFKFFIPDVALADEVWRLKTGRRRYFFLQAGSELWKSSPLGGCEKLMWVWKCAGGICGRDTHAKEHDSGDP